MGMQVTRVRYFVTAIIVAAIASAGFTSSALAHTGEWARFNYCPSTTSGVFKCVQSVSKGGEVVLGKKTVPIVNPVTLQGGVAEAAPEETPEEGIAKFFAATNGETLSKTPQPVPGGLTGLVNCKKISLGFLRASCEAIFENGLTGVNATVELARPASDIRVGESNLISREGLALKLPVRVHLENPLLGSTCYIGSSSSPIIWNLTTGTTAPPAPNTPISGKSGSIEFKENAQILVTNGTKLVENAWAAPSASGCGGFLVEYILDPIINTSVGVPSAAGNNATILENTSVSLALASEVTKH